MLNNKVQLSLILTFRNKKNDLKYINLLLLSFLNKSNNNHNFFKLFNEIDFLINSLLFCELRLLSIL